jgi:hypothetical protein
MAIRFSVKVSTAAAASSLGSCMTPFPAASIASPGNPSGAVALHVAWLAQL